jgi:uncharacterized protein YjdB
MDDAGTMLLPQLSAISATLVTSIKVTGPDSIYTKGGAALMHAAVLPANATNPAYTWSISDTATAIISVQGKVTARKNGTVTVTATAVDASGTKGTKEIKITHQSPTAAIENSASLLAVFPNPASDYIQLKNMNSNSVVSVFNMTGQLVISKNVNVDSKIDISSLKNGIYTVRIENKENVQTIKLVVRK